MKSSRTCTVATVSLPFGIRQGLGAILGEKWLLLAQNCADLGGHLPTWRQASYKQQSSKHFSFPFWPLLGLIAPGSTLL